MSTPLRWSISCWNIRGFEFVGLDLDDLTVEVDSAHQNGLGPQHLDVQAGNRETPLVVGPFAVGFDHFGIDDGHRVLVDVPHHHLLLDADLRRGQCNTVAGVDERVEHVVDEADDPAIDVVDEGRLGLQHGIAVCTDCVRHLCQATGVSADRDGSTSGHYFDDRPDTPSDPVMVDVTLPDTAFVMETDRGVFSRGHLDTATSMLLRADLPIASTGNLLDLGCGAGPIALTMARRSPDATVWAVDVNVRARELCVRNAERNGLTNIRVAAPADVPSHLRFATIWSNPPIRIGKSALHELLLDWLGRLAPDGQAALVVQKHLGADSLQRWLHDRGFAAERIASKAGFRLLTVAAR